LYRILPGRSDRSYGIHVAQIAGLPPETVKRASQLLETLAVQTEGAPVKPTARREAEPRSDATPSGQLSLFTEYLEHPVVEVLRKLDLTALTPMQAFDELRKLREKIT
jgi:DNA mismatch repair protein MutS